MIPIIFSTITGNGYKLADAAAKSIPEHCGPYNIRYITDEVIDRFDTFVLTYWCDKGSADKDTIDLIHRMKNKKIIILGSLGAAKGTKHFEDVYGRVSALVQEENTLLGHYLCQGSIDLRRTWKKVREGKMTEERFEKQKLTVGHPTAEELQGATDAVKEFLKAV